MLRTPLVALVSAFLALPAAAFEHALDDADFHGDGLQDAAFDAAAAGFDAPEEMHGGRHFAQHEGPRGRHKRLSPEQRQQLEEEVQRKMHTFVTVELSSRLQLDEATSLKLAAAIRAHRDQQREARRKMRAESLVLERLLREGASEAQLRQQTALVVAAAAARPHLGELAKETEKFLSAEQQAKLVLAFPEVMRDVGRMMKHSRRGPPVKP